MPAPARIPSVEYVKVCALYRSGKTLQEIGNEYGVTRERVRQILKKLGVPWDMGGVHIRAAVRRIDTRRKQLDAKRERITRLEAYCGCGYDEIMRICDGISPWTAKAMPGSKNPGGAYVMQRQNAQKRGIEWKLSLTDWWRIWQESGQWEKRGRGEGYCMARYGDSGAYEAGNVYICTIGQNFSDSHITKPRRRLKCEQVIVGASA